MMAENCITFTKEHLNDCDLLPRAIPYHKNALCMILTLSVKNYRNMENNIIYYASAKIFENIWTNKLVITNGTLFSFMSTNVNVENPTSSICKVQGDSVSNNDIRRSGGLLILEFCHTAILDPKKKYLHGNSLLIDFMYDIELSKNDNKSAGYRSLKKLIASGINSEDLKHLFSQYLKEDLNIRLMDKTISCHKSILSAHSELFADFSQKNELVHFIAVKEHHKFFQYVLAYIYTGKLEDLDEEYMWEIYRIATALKINSLKKECEDYFKRENLMS